MISTSYLAIATVLASTAVWAASSLGGGVTDPTDLVTVAPGRVVLDASGDFSRGGRRIAAPTIEVVFDRPLQVMRRQVSEADYAACVADGACAALDLGDDAPRADLPAVGLSWRDATAYATWLSARTGRHYRLPSDAEWAHVAAEAFAGEIRVADESDDPTATRRALYAAEAERDRPVERAPRPFGGHGRNSNGLLDVAGNVWEWTDGCWSRRVETAGAAPRETVNCGVRIVEGRHRGYVSDFVRDARGGGCSVGTPPANLGLRLVRDDDGPSTATPRIVERSVTGPGRS